jgi:hypothetical protein
MKIRPLKYGISVKLEDIDLIRSAIKQWGKDEKVVSAFDGAKLHDYFEKWEIFVDSDWEAWDPSEYDHDVGCRYFIQICIEKSCSETRTILEREVQPLDDEFKGKMKPRKYSVKKIGAPFKEGPYFWELHTIHPELMEI